MFSFHFTKFILRFFHLLPPCGFPPRNSGQGLFTCLCHMVFSQALVTWYLHKLLSHGIFTWPCNMVFSHALVTWYFHMPLSHDIFTCPCHMIFSHALVTWYFHMPLSHGIFTCPYQRNAKQNTILYNADTISIGTSFSSGTVL